MKLRNVAMVAATVVMAVGLAGRPAGARQAQPPSGNAPVEAGAENGPAGAVAEKPEERVICRREKTIGSNRSTRVCRTEAQIREQREAAANAIGSGETSGGGSGL